MFLGSTEATLMGSFTPISRQPEKCVMTSPWIHTAAPLCTQAILKVHFAGRREIGVKSSMRAASVYPKSTQLTPLTMYIIWFFWCVFSKHRSKRQSRTARIPLSSTFDGAKRGKSVLRSDENKHCQLLDIFQICIVSWAFTFPADVNT